MGFFGIVALTDKNSKIASMRDFIAQAKAHPDKFNIGSINVGSGQHMAATLFKTLTGMNVTIVPYKTTPNLLMALKSNDIQLAFEVMAPALPLVRSGEIKGLAVSSATRSRSLPDVPTLMESGVGNYNVTAWNGVAAPAKTPRAIVERLNKEINAAMAQPDVRKAFEEVGIEARGGSPEDLRDILDAEVVKWTNLVKTAKIEKQ
jgi:tripartite-type tricarboxylate transporter receptor subunit TctC